MSILYAQSKERRRMSCIVYRVQRAIYTECRRVVPEAVRLPLHVTELPYGISLVLTYNIIWSLVNMMPNKATLYIAIFNLP